MATQYSKTSADQKIILDLKVNSREAIEAILQAQEQIAKLKEEQKQLEAEMRKGNGTKEMKERLVLIKTELRDLNAVMKANQKELDNNVNQYKQNGDSINAMRSQLKNLRQEYEDLSAADRDSEFGQNMLKDIDELTTKVLGLEKAQQDYTRQVGNYELAAKPARTALREMRMECQNLALALQETSGQMQAQSAIVQQLAATTGTETDEYKEAVAELNRLTKAYDDAKVALSDMEKKTGEMADVLADSNQRINSFANDQQKIVAMQEGVSALSSAYDVLQGSLAACGIKSQAMVEIYSKMQIVQRSLNGILTIYKALNKDSNLMITLRNKLEKARLVWAKAYTASLEKQGKLQAAAVVAENAENAAVTANTSAKTANAAATTVTATAEGAATTATFSLKAAFDALTATLASNPITAIALAVTAAVTAIVGAVKKLKKADEDAGSAAKEAAEKEKELTDALKNRLKEQVTAMSSATSQYDDQIIKIRSLQSVINSEIATYKQKAEALRELNKIVPEYNGKISETGALIAGNTAAIEDYVNALEAQARAQGYIELLTDEYKKEAEIQRELLQLYDERKKYQDAITAFRDPTGSWGTPEFDFSTATAEVERLKRVENDLNDQLAQQQTNIAKLTEMAVSYGATFTSAAKTTEKTLESNNTAAAAAQTLYDSLLSLASEYYKSIEDLEKKAVQTQTEMENARYEGESKKLEEAKQKAEQLYDQLSKDPKLLKELQKKNKFLSLETLQNQIGILNDELDNAEKRHLDNIAKINEETNTAFKSIIEKLQRDIDKASENTTVRYTAQLQDRLSALDAELKKELESHEYTEAQKLAITEKYNQKKAQVLKEFSDGTNNLGNYSGINNLGQLKDQLAADMAELQARQDAELAVFEGTEAEKAAIVEKYANRRVDLENRASKQEAQIWLNSTISIAQAMSTALGGMQDLLNTIAEDDAEMQKYSKALALAQIAVSTGLAIAQAVQAGVQAGGFTGAAAPVTIPIFIAELVGIVGGAVASAISTLKSASTPARPRFATGGPVDRSVSGGMIGKHTTRRKDDTVDAKLSLGEYVIKSEIVKKYGIGFFDELNGTKRRKPELPMRFAGGGSVPSMQTISTTELSMDYTQMEDMFTRVVENIQPVVSVTEITDKQNRVKVKENTASY